MPPVTALQTRSNAIRLRTVQSIPSRCTTAFIESPSPIAGFPSPATDYVESALDLNEYLIENAPATFLCRVSGISMVGAGIHDRDIVAVNRAKEPGRRSIVVATLDGDLLIKWLRRVDGRLGLFSDHPTINFPVRYFDEAQDAQVWGVVTGLARRF